MVYEVIHSFVHSMVLSFLTTASVFPSKFSPILSVFDFLRSHATEMIRSARKDVKTWLELRLRITRRGQYVRCLSNGYLQTRVAKFYCPTFITFSTVSPSAENDWARQVGFYWIGKDKKWNWLFGGQTLTARIAWPRCFRMETLEFRKFSISDCGVLIHRQSCRRIYRKGEALIFPLAFDWNKPRRTIPQKRLWDIM